jgi:hypothetical protein
MRTRKHGRGPSHRFQRQVELAVVAVGGWPTRLASARMEAGQHLHIDQSEAVLVTTGANLAVQKFWSRVLGMHRASSQPRRQVEEVNQAVVRNRKLVFAQKQRGRIQAQMRDLAGPHPCPRPSRPPPGRSGRRWRRRRRRGIRRWRRRSRRYCPHSSTAACPCRGRCR